MRNLQRFQKYDFFPQCGVDDLIDAVDKAADVYPWEMTYKAFTGPNSNTFTAWNTQQVPELKLDLQF